ncbi:UvrD-helicase domain-containing protein [Thioalkalivibrio sp. ALE19]|uniref:UvrD-helicase domain-containing protein n=1 Tax=Thioalkalivibrio sp. ALE19 TaxID=1266909 RepID=UPI0004087B51|nr:UvrD-helicase domain-containing protein [Thioalkalivibrio sp. ALE19]
MKPTREQQAVIEARGDRDLAVNALAGAAKTTTLEMRARANPNRKILYVAFNKAIETEARKRFPSNVTCKTTHALAFRQFGRRFANADQLREPRAADAQRVFSVKALKDRGPGYIRILLETVQQYMASSDREIGPQHVPETTRKGLGFPVDMIVPHATHLWERMKDVRDDRMPMPHDGYLKLFQLSGPQFGGMFDEIDLDEAQDTNPALFDVFRSQQGIQKVAVGDTHQSIYGFRGAMDVMQSMEGAETLALTGSFRFGPELAEVANLILGDFLNSEYLLSGLGERTDIRTGGDFLHDSQPACLLYRTNGGLFQAAAYLLENAPRQHWVGGLKSYGLNTIMDVYRLYSGEKREIRDPMIRRFRDLDEAQEYASAAGDNDLLSRIRIVMRYGDHIPQLLSHLRDAECSDPNQADIILTTAHRAKGREFDRVVIGNDFVRTMYEPRAKGIGEESALRVPRIFGWLPDERDHALPSEEELRLLYMAVTRGRREVRLNRDLVSLWNWARGVGEEKAA